MIHQTDVIEGLKQLKDNEFDVVLIDPPYNIKKNFGIDKDNLPLQDYVSWCKVWIAESTRVLKESGTIYIYGFSEILTHLSVNLKLDHRWLIWHYTNKTVPGSNFWQRSYESILCGWKDKEKRIFNVDAVRESYTDTFLKNAAGKSRKPTKGRFAKGDKETIYQANEKGALPRDVIKVPALAGGAGRAERFFYSKSQKKIFPVNLMNDFLKEDVVCHPTQKPFKLTHKLLSASIPKDNGKILIPFAGSGSECLVAKQLGLEWTAFEINPEYIEMANCLLNSG